MHKQQYSSYNFFFLVPYILWVILAYPLTNPQYLQRWFSLVNTHYSPFADFLMYYATMMGEGLIITALLALLLFIPSFRNWWYVTTAILCNVFPSLFMQWVKHHINAPRPLKYFGDPAWIHISPHWPRLMDHSFPSGHTTGAFSMFCFLSMLLPGKYKIIGFVFFLLALLVAYSRLYLAAHFLEDVYWGSVIGGLGSLVLLAIMQDYKDNFFRKNV